MLKIAKSRPFTLCDTIVVLFMVFLDEIHCLQERLPNIPGTSQTCGMYNKFLIQLQVFFYIQEQITSKKNYIEQQ